MASIFDQIWFNYGLGYCHPSEVAAKVKQSKFFKLIQIWFHESNWNPSEVAAKVKHFNPTVSNCFED